MALAWSLISWVGIKRQSKLALGRLSFPFLDTRGSVGHTALRDIARGAHLLFMEFEEVGFDELA